MVDWLNSVLHLKVELATPNSRLKPGTILVSPVDTHLELCHNSKVNLSKSTLSKTHSPSIDLLFQSAAKVYGSKAMGIILSGMGNDGAQGLLKMHSAGSITIAQNEASSIVYGMPKEASKLRAVTWEMDPLQIIDLLISIGNQKG